MRQIFFGFSFIEDHKNSYDLAPVTLYVLDQFFRCKFQHRTIRIVVAYPLPHAFLFAGHAGVPALRTSVDVPIYLSTNIRSHIEALTG
jgi:hypothetical protein